MFVYDVQESRYTVRAVRRAHRTGCAFRAKGVPAATGWEATRAGGKEQGALLRV